MAAAPFLFAESHLALKELEVVTAFLVFLPAAFKAMTSH